MRILIIGDLTSIHTYNFIKYTAKSFSETEIVACSPAGLEIKEEYLSFYEKEHITIVQQDNRFLGEYENLIFCYLSIKDMGQFDVCHIHYLSRFEVFLGRLVAKQCKLIIANYWGSDWLRISDAERQWQKKQLHISDYIVTDSKQIYMQLEDYYNGEYNDKIRYIRFKLPILEYIKSSLGAEEMTSFKRKYKIPDDKIVVVCGYNAVKAHKHLEMIRALEKLNIEEKQKIFAIFPMTYGKDFTYMEMVRRQLDRAAFGYLILEDFMKIHEIASLRRCTDVFMLMRTSDAYSSTIIEYTYCNTVIINGKWLDYSELEKAGAFYEKVEGVEGITEKLSYILRNMEGERERFKRNREAVKLFQEEYDKNKLWEELYLSTPVTRKEKNNINESVLLKEASVYFNKITSRNILIMDVLYRMAGMKNIEETINDWIAAWKVKVIGIYGAGRLGDIVYGKVYNPQIEKIIMFDRNSQQGSSGSSELLSPEDVYHNEMDVLIITPVLEMDQIKTQYENRIKARVLTIEEWLSKLERLG